MPFRFGWIFKGHIAVKVLYSLFCLLSMQISSSIEADLGPAPKIPKLEPYHAGLSRCRICRLFTPTATIWRFSPIEQFRIILEKSSPRPASRFRLCFSLVWRYLSNHRYRTEKILNTLVKQNSSITFIDFYTYIMIHETNRQQYDFRWVVVTDYVGQVIIAYIS